jgi:hypothetical protein
MRQMVASSAQRAGQRLEPTVRTEAAASSDCPPEPKDEHPRMTALLDALAVAGAIWDVTGAMASQAWRRREAADCPDTEGGAA